MNPSYTILHAPRYWNGRMYRARASIQIFRGGELRAGTIFWTTGRFGSESPTISLKYHPEKCLAEIYVKVYHRKGFVLNHYWISRRDLMRKYGLVEYLQVKVRQRMRKARIQDAFNYIKSFGSKSSRT